MKRSVIQHGPSSLTISLPAEWVKKRHIEKGDEVEVQEEGDALKVYAEQKGETRKRFRLDVSSMGYQLIRTTLSMAHKSGFDEIRFEFSDSSVLRNIQQDINTTFLGFEIIEQGNNYCVIGNISHRTELRFEPLLRRSFLVLISLSRSALQAIQEQDWQSLKGFLTLEQTLNKLTNYCHRMLNTNQYRNIQTPSYMYLLVWEVESIGDEYRDIIHVLSENPPEQELNSDVTRILTKTNQLLYVFYETFYSFSLEEAGEIKDTAWSHLQEIRELRTHVHGIDGLVLHHLRNVLTRMQDSIPSMIGLKVFESQSSGS